MQVENGMLHWTDICVLFNLILAIVRIIRYLLVIFWALPSAVETQPAIKLLDKAN